MKVKPNLEHIAPSHRKTALLDDKQRIVSIYTDRWINYPEVNSIRSVVRAVYEMPRNIQAQCILVSGHSGMGKTSLFTRIESDIETLRKRDQSHGGCISFSMPADPTFSGFEDIVGEVLGVPIGKIRNGVIPKTFSRLAHLRNLRMIVIDEVHNLLNASRMDQRKSLALLRAISGPPLSLSIVALGIDDAEFAIRGDDQLDRRFQIYNLPHWKEDEKFRSFLAAYESILPLRRPSELSRKDKVKSLLGSSGGITGNIVKRITRGAVWAILDRKEAIDLECLEKAADIPPYIE
ncbi:TniB family NTP-binding protein [Pseudomonas sp. NPDC089569]|uniref:TniB family NTP-binding protein n=1 Tax=Pseudomonas sp. NPDC089569 TaxID=3390722 RepID=UPI003D06609D